MRKIKMFTILILGIGSCLPQVYSAEVEDFVNETRALATPSIEGLRPYDDSLSAHTSIPLKEVEQVQQLVAEFEMPTRTLFDEKDKERNSRYYKYDKLGRLVSVEYAKTIDRNEYYTYDKLGKTLYTITNVYDVALSINLEYSLIMNDNSTEPLPSRSITLIHTYEK